MTIKVRETSLETSEVDRKTNKYDSINRLKKYWKYTSKTSNILYVTKRLFNSHVVAQNVADSTEREKDQTKATGTTNWGRKKKEKNSMLK